jgi:ligand-binding sensor domain-containing protein/two-component sensor histidine kinase
MKSRFYITLVFIFYVFNLLAQSPAFRHYTTDDGLPSSEVYYIIQDKKGYIWFATDMGVSRFDGYNFENFDIQKGLPSNTIFEIFEDYKGRIWFSSFSGELSYYYNDTIVQYPYNDKLVAQFTESPLFIKGAFFVDTSGKITMGLQNQGVFEAFPDGKIINKYSKNTFDVIHLIVDNKNEKSYVLTYFRNKSNKIKIFDKTFLGILKDDKLLKLDNDIFVHDRGARSGLVQKDYGHYIYSLGHYIYEFKDSTLIFKREMTERVFSLGIDKQKNLCVGLKNRGVYNYKNGDISKPHYAHYLKNHTISYAFLDNEGGYWMATIDDGVYYMSSSFYKTYNKTSGLANNNTECVVIDKDNDIWIGTNDNYVNLISNDSIIKILVSPDPNIVIKAICIDDDNLWIGTNTYLYYIPNIYNQKKLFSKTGHFNIKENYSFFSTKEFKKSKNKGIWIGTSRTLYKLIDKNIIFNGYESHNYTIRTEAIHELPNGDVLLGTLQGLYKFVHKDVKKVKGDFIYYGEKNDLFKNRILDIVFCDYNNKFWFATKGAGILVYSEDTVFQITKAHGLTSNSVTSIYSKDNVIWAGTNLGLNKITLINNNPLKYNIKTITIQNGLASNEVRDIQVTDSMVYVATKSGLTVFENSEYTEQNILPPVYITNVSIKGKDTLVKDSYNLPHNKNSITIDYFGITYKHKGKLLYKHKLTGIDEDWVTSNKTQAQYPILPPGNYFFQVYVKNYDGFWSENPAAISFVINSPFWLKWWFIGSVIIIISLIIWIIIRWRIKELRKQDKLQHEILSYRQQALSKQMNPHFIFNSLNSIQRFILSNDKLSSSKYLTKFANLMRIILSMSQKESISINDEINALELYLELESLRFEGKFDFHFIIDPNININDFYIPSFFVQPLVENAIWHGLMNKKGKGNLLINFCIEDGVIACIVEDDGVGRKKAQKIKSQETKSHKSLSTSITKTRLELLNYFYDKKIDIIYYDLNDDNGNATGTKVKITFPIIKKH